MTRPGDRIQRLTARLCSERTRRRLVDPAIADLQAEAAAARRTGSAWQALRSRAAGYVSIVKVLAIGLCGDARRSVATWEHGEAAIMRRGMWVAVAIIGAATAVFELPLLTSMYSIDPSVGERVRLATYLAPSTLALTVPLGLGIATAWVLHGAARGRKVAIVALFAAAAMSVAMFANLAWLTPDANQAFREEVMAHHDPPSPSPARGDGELRLGELRHRLQQARNDGNQSDVRSLEVLYYRKWATGAAPLAIVGLIVALAFRRSWSRAGLTAVACGVYATNYALWISVFPLAHRGVASPLVLAWAGNALCAILVVVVTSSRSRARAPA
jgi:lipopolysaccharide export LptBFGC system permease protein LptF